jgi:hypothetical protein
MDIKEINRSIITGNLTNDQLTSIIDAVKFARSQLMDQTKRSLTLGSKVKFNSTKRGKMTSSMLQFAKAILVLLPMVCGESLLTC